MDLSIFNENQLNELWDRLLSKKYAYGYGRGYSFINRCERLQTKISMENFKRIKEGA